MTTTKRKSWPLKASQLLLIHSINQLRNHSHNHISITCNTQQGKNSIHIFSGAGLGSIKQEARYDRFTVSLHQRKLLSTITHVCLCFTTYTRSPSCDTVTQHCTLQTEKEQEHRMRIICHTIFTTQPKHKSRLYILCLQDQHLVDKTQNLDRTI